MNVFSNSRRLSVRVNLVVGRQQKDIHLEPPIDFEMTYPCFVPLQPNGAPEAIEYDNGDISILIFTDDDLLNTFGPCSTTEPLAFSNDYDLMMFLKRSLLMETAFGFAAFVTLDPRRESTSDQYYPICEFVHHLVYSS